MSDSQERTDFVTLFGEPLESKGHRWPWLEKRLNRSIDLLVFGLVISILLAVVAYLMWNVIKQDDDKIALVAALLTVLVAIAGKLCDVAHKRLALVNMLASDILSIGRVFVASNIIGVFYRLHSEIPKNNDGLEDDDAWSSGFSGEARRENYFRVFEESVGQLGSLASATVTNITAFYTFLRAARDATEALGHWKTRRSPPKQKTNDILEVIYLCYLCAIHGRLALMGLIKHKEIERYARDVFLAIEVQCIDFLATHMDKNDYRYVLINQRRSAYESTVAAARDRGLIKVMEKA
jgi:hypothetical protein